MLFLHNIRLIESCDFKRKVKQGTCYKKSHPLSTTTYQLLSDPIHGKKNKTNENGFEKYVHL